MEKKFDVVALGELLIDFIEYQESTQGNKTFEANPGGAPCNVLSMLQNLGKKTAFIGKVGNDQFGALLRDAITSVGIDDTGLLSDETVPTTLAFVHKLPNGDRSFSFYRDPGADMMLRKDEVMTGLIGNSRLFHFGTLSSTAEGVREATRYALDTAKKAGVLISFDPNLRERLWKNLADAKREIEYGMGFCDILKISDNEIEFMTGSSDYDKAVDEFRKKYNIPLILVTLGKNGSRAYYKDMIVDGAPCLRVNTIEKTGAGDTFCACAINYVLEHGLDNLQKENLEELLTFANAAAALITTRKGALKVMPAKEEILELVARG